MTVPVPICIPASHRPALARIPDGTPWERANL